MTSRRGGKAQIVRLDKRGISSTLLNRCLDLTLVLVLISCGPALAHAQAGTPHVNSPSAVIVLQDIDSAQTPPPGNYRWLDVADQPYSDAYRAEYDYTFATVQVTFVNAGSTLHGTLDATKLKPNFTYQLKLAGTPGTAANERIGLAGRWWQEEWDGDQWTGGRNLNNKGDGSSPSPNDLVYYARRDIIDGYGSSPTGLRYRYAGYLVFDWFTTDGAGEVSLDFQADSSYHVLWKTTQRTWTADDGPLKTTIFDADLSPAYPDFGGDDYLSKTVSTFGEWERLPVGGVYLQPGAYSAQMILTEESFHGSGDEYVGGWAAAMGANIQFTIAPPTAVDLVSFTATPQAGAIQLSWETAAELDLLGFNLYRAGPVDGQPIPLNARLIPSRAPGSLTGASYLFVDRSAAPQVTYTYWLEHLDLHGTAFRHSPASAALTGFRVFLPRVVR